ncbi:putative dipeptidyl-aminopeptidase B [Podosphaera aphanis]|nr:putative dipeptidyl-aminopeptidase B [Podosphaera aphanis]
MSGHREENTKYLVRREERDRNSEDSISLASTTSLLFARIGERAASTDSDSIYEKNRAHRHRSDSHCYDDDEYAHDSDDYEDNGRDKIENSPFLRGSSKAGGRKFRRLIWIIGLFLFGTWLLALIIFLSKRTYTYSAESHIPGSTASKKPKKVTLDGVLKGQWHAKKHEISWFEGANGEDGLLLEEDVKGKDYLVLEDIRKDTFAGAMVTKTLIRDSFFTFGDEELTPSQVIPSRDLKKVLIATDSESVWRYSSTARYWIFDVETQTAQPLDPDAPDSKIQLASWSPQSDAIVFTRDNNIFVRKLSSSTIIQITTDGSTDLFYGIPDWVYEEEVFGGNSATWWAEDGKYIAFLRTNESQVPEYPVQYFLSRPSGTEPLPGEAEYPEVRKIKYPKAGAPNPTVDLQFYDLIKGDVFQVKIADSFAPEDLLITEVVWAGSSGKVLIRESNRESDILQVVLVDVIRRTGNVVRTENFKKIDGGWFELTESTKYIPADPLCGRPDHGYVDTIVHDNYNHLAYFTPLDNPSPIILTSGNWEVVDAPSAVDLQKNLVYFVATKESPIQRHVYSVSLDGTALKPLTNISSEGYYSVSFSSGAAYALLNYDGPDIPWQKVISTPSNDIRYEKILEQNSALAKLAQVHELPVLVHSTIKIEGVDLQVLERRPPNFDEKKKYPVLFYLYGGPGSQTVTKKFSIDFQAYVAANLGYIVVTVDGRGTGFIGRKARIITRGNLGYYEAHDQIATAKLWAQKSYVDSSKIAIWGWSYGGYMTLKTLEQDAGQTFSYGMAVAPVTNWKYYDSIYTERYMYTPQHNPTGYYNSSISNMTALGQNVRFLVMHGVADDNVHFQNTLTLLDKLDISEIENYDVHVFPDSNHAIFFHNANRIVYHKLNNWLINAFNGEWLKTKDVQPLLLPESQG